MAADIHTNVIANSEKWKLLLVLLPISIAVDNDFHELIERSNKVRNADSKVAPTGTLDVGDA